MSIESETLVILLPW